jgi:hypothetical protein
MSATCRAPEQGRVEIVAPCIESFRAKALTKALPAKDLQNTRLRKTEGGEQLGRQPTVRGDGQ